MDQEPLARDPELCCQSGVWSFLVLPPSASFSRRSRRLVAPAAVVLPGYGGEQHHFCGLLFLSRVFQRRPGLGTALSDTHIRSLVDFRAGGRASSAASPRGGGACRRHCGATARFERRSAPAVLAAQPVVALLCGRSVG